MNRTPQKERLVTALNEVLDRHLGPGYPRLWPVPKAAAKLFADDSLSHLHLSPMDGGVVVEGLLDPAGLLGAMNPAMERKKLLKIRQLAKELAETLRELHPDAYGELITQSQAVRDLGAEYSPDLMPIMNMHRNRDFWVLFWSAAFSFDELMDKIVPAVSDLTDTAPVAGRRNLTNVIVIESLREVWEDRKKTPAPMNITDAGPFTDFIVEAFEALGLEGNPRAAMDSWREYRAKHPAKT
jgi:hypothetical protein